MKREGTIGAATVLAIAAVVGLSVQTGPKQSESGRADQTTAAKRSKPSLAKGVAHKEGPGCSSLREQLENFLDMTDLILPKQCYARGEAPRSASRGELTRKTSKLKFIIAMLPDPVHTHLPVLFDQFAVAVQEGAQDEKYDFDSSWLPWDEEESSYALLDDEKTSNREKELKEEQPGIILFRKNVYPIAESYREGLVVFVVGEEATQGIHKAQFRNAIDWIAALQPAVDVNGKSLAILGPTFSGSFPSVTQALRDPKIAELLDLDQTRNDQRLAMYSGSVSGNEAARGFQEDFGSQVVFHSFVLNDDEILQRFCNYITREQPRLDTARVAILSEDETAYGKKIEEDKDHTTNCADKALWLYYPRDISALRGAYQTRSLFDVGTSPQPAETQRRNLPSDLADPSGKVHDSIRSYGGNQTPLSQEAFLLEIVAALRELHARYILLRGSNTLDQLFLTNFLRRNYPDGRIVIFGSDLMFIRERGAMGLSGIMTLSTYPLFPLERDWTEHQSLPATDRVFSADTMEGTYVAFRLLLNDKSLHSGKPDLDRCHVLDKDQDKEKEEEGENTIFLPRVSCTKEPPIPDYSPPFWTLPDQCGEMQNPNAANIANTGPSCSYPGPATWLSVIGVNRFWPIASLTSSPVPRSVDRRTTERAKIRQQDPGGRPEMPVGMKVGWIVLITFALFHSWCCWAGSYTAKPAFRAHFASTGDWRHTALVFSGSCCVAFLGIVAGWGCGVFSAPAAGLEYSWFAFSCVMLVCLLAWVAILLNSYTSRLLSKDQSSATDFPRMTHQDFITWNYAASGLFVGASILFYLSFGVPLGNALPPENRVLTYWRAMHLASGVSPIVPILSILIGLYLMFWFALHGLALFGPDRPRLPLTKVLALKVIVGKEAWAERDFLRMFSQEDAAEAIEKAAKPLTWSTVAVSSILFVVFLGAALGIAWEVPVRSLAAENYAIIFLVCLDACCTLVIVAAWRLYKVWEELKRLLTFLDRLPLRRIMAALHGFSWGSVWKMSGNVLEVRYKVISRQMECMNHTIATLERYLKTTWDSGAQDALDALKSMRGEGLEFADWYSTNYKKFRVGDLTKFSDFQRSIASASGTLFAKLLVPAWRIERESLLVSMVKDEKEEAAPSPPQAKDAHIRHAEEFVCLNYLGFIQNILGRLRTLAVTIVALFLAATIATSSYPFDPRQALSTVLIILFVISGVVIVKVYADMHRDATLSHVTNTKPGQLGAEFWFKIIGFGVAPLAGLMTRVFPGITDFVFSWLQPGIASLK